MEDALRNILWRPGAPEQLLAAWMRAAHTTYDPLYEQHHGDDAQTVAGRVMPEGPHDFAYRRDLRPGRSVKVRCRQCKHTGEVGVARILRLFTGGMPVAQL